MPADTNKPTTPIAELAEALNPPDGALADSLPFALTPEIPKPVQRSDEQPGLFPEDTP